MSNIKKIVFGSIAAVAVAAIIAFNVSMNTNSSNFSDISLANIEALAKNENSPKKGKDCKTERCKLDLGGGWFTSSVERTCIEVDDEKSTCTPVTCGEVFYGCN